jgi:hypothetical protein
MPRWKRNQVGIGSCAIGFHWAVRGGLAPGSTCTCPSLPSRLLWRSQALMVSVPGRSFHSCESGMEARRMVRGALGRNRRR